MVYFGLNAVSFFSIFISLVFSSLRFISIVFSFFIVIYDEGAEDSVDGA